MPLMPKVTVKANRLRQDLHYCKCEWIRSCGTLSQSLKYQPYLRRTVISSLRVSGKKKKEEKKREECPSNLLLSHDAFATAGHQDSELKNFSVPV